MDNEKTLEKLLVAVERVYSSPVSLMKRGLLIGLFSGIGATIGAALIILLIGFLVRSLGGVPVLGDWLNALSNTIPNGQ